ncbi:MAG: hypothetical protein E7376_00465 [Clostridiales bacterium]|nr:hypothetical protein [Clostridiales bacterium]
MLKDILPEALYTSLVKKCLEQEINEVRIRVNKPIVVTCNNKSYFLSENGIGANPNQAIFASAELINDIVFKACDYSIYSVNEQLKQGFLMVDGGIRLGICGEVVKDESIKTIKNFSSLCIRIPHLIKNAALPIFNQVLNNGELNNTLIISPPGAGKTTMLRDLIEQFSNHNYSYNIFIADERGEIVGGNKYSFGLGHFFDSISFLNKKDSILFGIRSMSPDIIVTDELGAKCDFEALEYAFNCGVTVIATMHAKNIEELKSKNEFQDMLQKKYFKRIVVLSKQNKVGTIEGIYRENLTRIYGGAI